MSRIVTLDFETFYSNDYSLTRMSTEDYVTDPRFEVILVSAKIDDGPVEWFTGTMKETHKWLSKLDIPSSGLVCHNAMFDGLILKHHFHIAPKFYFDTAQMAQAVLKPYVRSVSLESCLEYCKLGISKGTEVKNMMGRSRDSLSRIESQRYGEYGKTDVEGTYRLWRFLMPQMTEEELVVADLTHRMYLEPQLELDATLLAEILAEVRAKKEQLMASISEQVTRTQLMSNEQFAGLLRAQGVEVPMKVSPLTGNVSLALAKSDTGFKQMQEDYADDPYVSALLAARLGIKSTIEETRTERLLQIAMRYPKLRVPLRYYAAHTGRYGGTEKINLQNPPRIDKSRLRFAIRAPKGHVMLAADLSQIEARITAWLARQWDLVEQFKQKRDVYSEFATIAYQRPITKANKTERFVGKTCILGLGYGMGSTKLKSTLFKDSVRVTEAESTKLVNTYRTTYALIPQLWRYLDTCIGYIHHGAGSMKIGPCETIKGGVMLPNDMPLIYHQLNQNSEGQWVYRFGYEVRTLWGGKLTENIVQALARIVIVENMLTIEKELGLRPVLQVHDELDYVIPEAEADATAQAITRIMSVPPAWAENLPVAVEVNYGPTFGDCK